MHGCAFYDFVQSVCYQFSRHSSHNNWTKFVCFLHLIKYNVYISNKGNSIYSTKCSKSKKKKKGDGPGGATYFLTVEHVEGGMLFLATLYFGWNFGKKNCLTIIGEKLFSRDVNFLFQVDFLFSSWLNTTIPPKRSTGNCLCDNLSWYRVLRHMQKVLEAKPWNATLNIPILPEAFLTFASKSSIGPSYAAHGQYIQCAFLIQPTDLFIMDI